jgi:CTD small phosphatase-like protein 2
LQELAKHFEIVVFTASHACYANPVIDYLDPEGTLVTKRLFRDNCRQVSESLYVKDLTVFKNRQLKNMVLIDNAAYSYSLQLDNGVPIVPFYNNKKDTELKELAHLIIELADVDDVRPVLRDKFKNGFISENSKNMNLLFQKLFGI